MLFLIYSPLSSCPKILIYEPNWLRCIPIGLSFVVLNDLYLIYRTVRLSHKNRQVVPLIFIRQALPLSPITPRAPRTGGGGYIFKRRMEERIPAPWFPPAGPDYRPIFIGFIHADLSLIYQVFK
jgi:hypothetical protein